MGMGFEKKAKIAIADMATVTAAIQKHASFFPVRSVRRMMAPAVRIVVKSSLVVLFAGRPYQNAI